MIVQSANSTKPTATIPAPPVVTTGTYLSADEVERADALTYGYEKVCQRLSEVGVLGTDEILVIDGNTALDATAVGVALAAARRGVTVGIHAYHFASALAELLAEPLVVTSNTHARLLPALQRLIATRRTIQLDL